MQRRGLQQTRLEDTVGTKENPVRDGLGEEVANKGVGGGWRRHKARRLGQGQNVLIGSRVTYMVTGPCRLLPYFLPCPPPLPLHPAHAPLSTLHVPILQHRRSQRALCAHCGAHGAPGGSGHHRTPRRGGAGNSPHALGEDAGRVEALDEGITPCICASGSDLDPGFLSIAVPTAQTHTAGGGGGQSPYQLHRHPETGGEGPGHIGSRSAGSCGGLW